MNCSAKQVFKNNADAFYDCCYSIAIFEIVIGNKGRRHRLFWGRREGGVDRTAEWSTPQYRESPIVVRAGLTRYSLHCLGDLQMGDCGIE